MHDMTSLSLHFRNALLEGAPISGVELDAAISAMAFEGYAKSLDHMEARRSISM
jgi:hypothetical protein